MLPDEVLLEIFNFYADEVQFKFTKKRVEAWLSLVHVCRQWRDVVFGSPRRLHLRLVCTPGTPARDMVDVWPALPLRIELLIWAEGPDTSDMNNIISVLKHDVCVTCVSQIKLVGVPGLQLEKVLAAMQDPFPGLIHFELWSYDEMVPILPNSFLGGSTPSLRFLLLSRVPFPGLRNLLISATHLVDLHLWGIPRSSYISPEAMLATLHVLTGLESLSLKFQVQPRSPYYNPNLRTHHVYLNSLKRFWYKGDNEYLDELVASIVTPGLEYLDITFFNDIIFETPQLAEFITSAPTLRTPKKAHISFEHGAARVNLLSQTSGYGEIILEISCRGPDWQVTSLEGVCTSCLPSFSTLEDLCIFEHSYSQLDWQDIEDDFENKLWLDLFHPFTHVKNLYLSEVSAPRIALALQGLIVDRTTDVLPSLQNIFLEGLQPLGPVRPVQKAIGKFVDAREVTGHPIAISRWDRSQEVKVLGGR